jgi:hypothetical protein
MKPGATAQAAADIVRGARNTDYGDPCESFGRIVEMFRLLTGKQLSVVDGMKFMLCVKLVRDSYRHRDDNMVDVAGYADMVNVAAARYGHPCRGRDR